MRTPIRTGLLLLALAPWSAQAHQSSDSYLTLRAGHGAGVSLRWEIALRDLDYALALDQDHDGRITGREVRERLADIDGYSRSHLTLATGAGECTLAPLQHAVTRHGDGSYLATEWQAACPAEGDALVLRYRLFAGLDPTHRGLLKLDSAAGIVTTVLAPDDARHLLALGHPAPLAALRDYGRQGVAHIWSGIDHLLFLLALLLPCVFRREEGAWRVRHAFVSTLAEVARVVTAFTVAHSITLAAAALNLVQLPSRAVESAIAASVVLAALNNLWPRVRDGRWKMAFLFGLLHGFGFAAVLQDLALPRGTLALALLGFNLGVEAGQLAVVLAFLALAWPLRGTRFYRCGILSAGSAAVALLAAVWLVERACDVRILPFTV